MRNTEVQKKKKKKTEKRQSFFDYNLLATVIILICFGLVMLYSASSYYETESILKTPFFKQFIIILGAMAVSIGVSFIPYHFWIKLSPAVYVVAFVLMALVPFIGKEVNGAKRWIYITSSIGFQPSEIAKIAVILIMAKLVLDIGRNIKLWRCLIFMLLAVGIQSAGALFLTKNLSTAVIIAGIGVGLIFIYHPGKRVFAIGFAVCLILLIGFITYMKLNYIPGASTNFRMTRILVWFDPENFLTKGGYQVMQGLYAIGSGGFFGKGLGNSTQKISKIPEAQNDMIFSIICEELGLFGAILLLVIFAYLIYRLFYIAQNAPDLYGSIIASGVMLHFAIQILLNIAVVLNVIPTTGISLPFVSYGGTAVAFLLGEIGICLNISRQIKLT